jgi:hypothetical protein
MSASILLVVFNFNFVALSALSHESDISQLTLKPSVKRE